MAFDVYFADRIRYILHDKNILFSELKMMGTLCFKVKEKMLCAIHIDKKYGDSLLMARIGKTQYESAIHNPVCLPMDFTGKPMKGYVFVTPEGFDTDEDLTYWIDLCLRFNPEAKESKKKKK